MAKPIEIGVGSETKAFKQGFETGVIKPIEDAEKALDALGKSDGTDKLEAGMKDAQKATERLSDETTDAAEKIEREFKQAYSSVRKSANDGTDGARQGVKDMGSEAVQEAREMGASFGSVEDALDSVQSVVANMFSGFGPAGVAAGVAAAAGIGVLMAQATDAAERLNTAKEKVGEIALELYDLQGDITRRARRTTSTKPPTLPGSRAATSAPCSARSRGSPPPR
jgi:hypothetical protein